MNEILEIILFSSIAGLPIFIGGLVSFTFQVKNFKLKDEINHWVIAFGGGVLIAAITFALIPKAIVVLNLIEVMVIFSSGTLSFMVLDIVLSKKGGSLAQVVSMLMDFIPEALALGASFAHSQKFGLLLAMFIGMQNLPEGFNSFIELKRKMKSRSTLLLMFGLSFIGIIAALIGRNFLSEKPKLISSIMMFAAGGILYLVFQDIAPLSKRKKDWIPATGASIGFLLGMMSEKILK
jgi:zinc transporter, ZIP family